MFEHLLGDLQKMDYYEMWAHIVSGASAVVAGIAMVQRLVRTVETWLKRRYPASSLIPFTVRLEYHLDSVNDLIQQVAMNWREWIAPKRRETTRERSKDRVKVPEGSAVAMETAVNVAKEEVKAAAKSPSGT